MELLYLKQCILNTNNRLEGTNLFIYGTKTFTNHDHSRSDVLKYGKTILYEYNDDTKSQ